MYVPDAPPQNMSIAIDLETGTITGILYLRINNEGLELEMDIPLSGSINLETRVITINTEELPITGILSIDHNSATGTTPEGGTWSVSR